MRQNLEPRQPEMGKLGPNKGNITKNFVRSQQNLGKICPIATKLEKTHCPISPNVGNRLVRGRPECDFSVVGRSWYL